VLQPEPPSEPVALAVTAVPVVAAD